MILVFYLIKKNYSFFGEWIKVIYTVDLNKKTEPVLTDSVLM